MDTLGVILVLIVFAIGGVVYIASRKPDVFRVERRMVINAPAEAIFDHINTIRTWEAWSPWQKKDPAMRQAYSGPAAGVGAAQAWEGNNQVGKGRMSITASEPPRRVELSLTFEKPFKAQNTVELSLRPVSSGTEIAWVMYGPANLMSKVMDLLMNMDKMCGNDFEAGLSNLKALVEPRA